MLKNIVRQYTRAYKWSRLAEQFRQCPQVIYFPIWFLFVMLETLISSSLRERIVFFLVFFPMMHSYFSGVMHSVRLNKMMYLCPMDSVGRRSFIYRFYYFRICFHMGFALAGILAMFLFGRPNILPVVGILCNDFVISCLLPWEKTGEDQWDITKETLYKVFIVYIAGICNMILTEALMDREALRGIAEGIAMLPMGILVLVQIPLCIRYRRFIKVELERAVEYEEVKIEHTEIEHGGGI